MTASRFHIRLACACGETTEFEAALGRPGGIAPIPCACGRKFVLKQLDASEGVSITIDPLGVTGGKIPEDPPEFH